MSAVAFLASVLVLAAGITGVVCALTARAETRGRRGLLIASAVVGGLAAASMLLTLPTLIDHERVRVIVISPGDVP